jgi:hypothetical protein
MSNLIDRQAAIDALGEKPLAWEQGEYEEGLQTQWESDVEAIKALSPTQTERKCGEWLERDVIDEPKGKHITQWQSAKCSVCGRYHTTPYLYSFTYHNFCPNCGAKMEVTE